MQGITETTGQESSNSTNAKATKQYASNDQTTPDQTNFEINAL